MMDFGGVVDKVKGFTMDEVKRLIEQKKQETISEIKETMHYVKMIQEETTFVRKQLETIN